MNSYPNQSAENPLVSIIIPFYNREDFLREAVESVESQSYQNWELLLVDDGSTDRSATIAREFVKKQPKCIFLLQHEDNRGASAARNTGIRHATGEYVTFLDSDDVFFPNTIEREVKVFKNNPEADAVCGTLQCWYSWSLEASAFERDFTVNLFVELEKLHEPPFLLIHNLRAGGRKPGINCVMLKKDFVRRVGVFEEDFRYAWEDQIFWAKVSLRGKIYVMDACLSKYRQHSASTCAVTAQNGDELRSIKRFPEWLENYLREQNISDQRIWSALRDFQKSIRYQEKLRRLKQLYRRLLPLYARYWLREKWVGIKNIRAVSDK
jgi:glycosyltransferase involved in cell wall biosynthesis